MAAASPDLGTGPTNQQGPSPQTGSTTPTGQVIGPLPASTMPGQLAQAIPTMANFQYLLAVDQNLQNQINNIGTGTGSVTEVDTQAPILGGPITSKGTISHATSGVVAGQYGNATNVPQITVDQFGHVDNVVNVPISGGGGGSVSITATSPIVVTPSPITGTGVVSHAASGVTPGAYGDATNVIQATFEADGHATAASSVAINFPVGGGGLGWYYGNGQDGSAHLDGTATVTWATKVSSVYTMTANVMLTSLTVDSGVTLITAGCTIYVNGTLTNNGTIGNPGPNGVHGVSAGVSGLFYGFGTEGRTTIDPTQPQTNVLGGAGGNGGLSTSVGTPRAANTFNPVTRANGGPAAVLSFMSAAQTGLCGNGLLILGGIGGVGGQATVGDPNGQGAGGGGGGIVGIFAYLLAGNGLVTAAGGSGANTFTSGCGAGGGGGGGVIWMITHQSNWNSLWTFSVAGGLGGTGAGGGGNGGNGTAGLGPAVFVL